MSGLNGSAYKHRAAERASLKAARLAQYCLHDDPTPFFEIACNVIGEPLPATAEAEDLRGRYYFGAGASSELCEPVSCRLLFDPNIATADLAAILYRLSRMAETGLLDLAARMPEGRIDLEDIEAEAQAAPVESRAAK